MSSKGGVGLEGRHLYELKEKIDRDWMAMYTKLPVMEMGNAAGESAAQAAQVYVYLYHVCRSCLIVHNLVLFRYRKAFEMSRRICRSCFMKPE